MSEPRPSPDVSGRREASRLGPAHRLALGGLALVLTAMLGVGRWLDPDPRGFGTHTQLGLPPCSFRMLTGLPCPGCGMTTAVSWAARGRMIRSAQANPAGAVLALASLAMIPWLAASAIRGRSIPFRSPDGPIVLAVLIVAALALVSWGVRVAQIYGFHRR